MVFYIISSIIILTAFLVIFSRNPIISALWLVVCLFAQAGLFILLDAYLVAALQVLLYAGAIMVMILFVIMLLNLVPAKLKWHAVTGERLIIGTAVLYLAGVVGMALFVIARSPSTLLGATRQSPENTLGTIESVGRLLLTNYAIPFELLSILLLTAIVGAVVMSRGDR